MNGFKEFSSTSPRKYHSVPDTYVQRCEEITRELLIRRHQSDYGILAQYVISGSNMAACLRGEMQPDELPIDLTV